jgi:glycosyltransferase involved in cell wall biosynthesis
MKIIHLVLGKANPERMNGVNKVVFEMVSTQHSLGFDVQLWGICKKPVHDYVQRNFRTKLFQMTTNKLIIHSDIQKAIKALSSETVIHIHGSFIPEFYHIGKLLTQQNIPFVYTSHGALAPAALQRRAWKKKIYFRLFESMLLRETACLIALGQSVYNNVNILFPVSRKVLIHNGQALKERYKVTRQERRLVFGFCGRIALEHKGLDLLLQGFKIFKDKGGNAAIHFIGNGKEMPKLKIIAKNLGVLNDLKFYGVQFNTSKFRLLSSFDVFVHTSRMEGFPSAVLEAAAIGLPLLISKHTNIWDYVDKYDCGLLCHPNTPENIAEQMLAFEKLYNANQITQMGENARKMVAELFDWKVICMQLYDEYMFATKQKSFLQLLPKTEN